MSETPIPRRAGNRKVLAFVIGGLILVGAVGVAFFADRTVEGPAGRAVTQPAATSAPAPIANPAEPAAPVAPANPAPVN
ncbi:MULTISPECIES: hypothetical protein [unclassified Aureimonas]|uniref:hypothetical protein n=1 Tax=unclassified Aureimonas TaxID=2615206 RepID=UPI0006F72B2C|nr:MULTISPECIES: hypothetical protein [unclassified Aureimonas]KQT64437.1 hypothetical protein ASG62_05625 [Aureimonas sp. Leaf427]KQT81625.1 hypothetical protein ASG54_02905 [Aureimonas sp. Leaf460]